MDKKDFQENTLISFGSSEEQLDLNTSIIPDLDCQEAKKHFTVIKESDDLSIANLLRLMKHLADDAIEHSADCPYHLDGSLAAARQLYQNKMS